MKRSTHCLLALPTLALAMAFAACSSSSNSGFPGEDSGTPEGGGEDATTEAGSPDSGAGDSTSPGSDATADSGEKTEAGGDGPVEAGNQPDSGTEDSAAPEASTPEASTPEASMPEASTPEASTVEASTTDSSVDAAGGDGASGDGSAVEAGTADASDGGGAMFVAPTCDGVISPGEYGNQTDGANQQTTGSQVWYLTWSSTTIYVGITNANIGEGAVMYFSDDPAIATDAGTVSNGNTVGFTYDGAGIAELPMHSQLVAYVKSSYNETRADDGTGGWSTTPVANALTVCTNATTNTREFSIPWTLISGGAVPSSFGWFGYVASATGFVYGQVPVGNPSGSVGTSAVFPWLYDVTDATPQTGTLPFANAVQR
jgi:hypothetical protein